MSYLVFARKWRPLNFEDVVGQEHVTNTLKKAIEKKRVAHAYIFTGTRGVGKTTTARILARALNCVNGPTPTPCGECENCKSIIKGSSFDVLEIDGASNNGVDNIRELRENVSYTSMAGKYRIFVIDEVHMLTKGAFNALLKTLEEPPKNVIFIFATTEPQKIPDTIHSRCQRFDFKRISTEQISGQLERICVSEKVTFEASALRLIAERAEGSMRDSLSLLDQVYSYCAEEIKESEVRSILGLVEIEVYTTLTQAVIDKTPLVAIQTLYDVLTRGFDLAEFIAGFQDYLRSLLFARLPGSMNKQTGDLSVELLKKRVDIASKFSEGDLLRMIEIVRKTESDLRWSTHPRFLVETTLIKLVYMDRTVHIEQILAHLASPSAPKLGILQQNDAPTSDKKKNESLIDAVVSRPLAQAVDPVAILETPPSPQVIDTSREIATHWTAFLETLAIEKASIATFLGASKKNELSPVAIDLRFPPHAQFQFAEVTKKSNRDIIQKTLNTFFNRTIELHISIEKAPDTPLMATGPKLNSPNRTSLTDDMENEPIIKNVITLFDGEVL